MNNSFRKHYPYLVSTMDESQYEFVNILTVSPNSLILPSRFDFMAKLIYLDSLNGNYDKERSYEIYKNHILAFGGRKIKEAGNPSKDSIEKYLDVFHSLNDAINSANEKSTDKNSTGENTANMSSTKDDSLWCQDIPIPIDLNFMALDGAHRISSAYGKKQAIVVYYLKDYVFPYRYDYLFFRLRLVPESMILEMALKYNQLKPLTLFKITYKNLLKLPFFLFTLKCQKVLSPVYMLKISSKSFFIVSDNTTISPSAVKNYLIIHLGKQITLDIICDTKEIDQALRYFLLPYQKKEKNSKYSYYIKDKFLRAYFIVLELIKKIVNMPLLTK